MSIKDFIELKGLILAVNDQGSLIIWDLRDISLEGICHFHQNVSLLKQAVLLSIDSNLSKIYNIGSSIIMHNQSSIYVTDLQSIAGVMESQPIKMKTIRNHALMNREEAISCLVPISDQILLIGTTKANLILFDLVDEQCIGTMQLPSKNNQPSNTFLSFSKPKQATSITSVQFIAKQSIAVVTSSNGSISVVSVDPLAYLFELNQQNYGIFENGRAIVESESQSKVFILHDNYVTEWSLKLRVCLGYYEYNQARSCVVVGQSLMIGGLSSRIYWNNAGKQDNLLVSSRAVHCLKLLGSEIIGVGGSDNMIDVMRSNIRLLTLFTVNQ